MWLYQKPNSARTMPYASIVFFKMDQHVIQLHVALHEVQGVLVNENGRLLFGGLFITFIRYAIIFLN